MRSLHVISFVVFVACHHDAPTAGDASAATTATMSASVAASASAAPKANAHDGGVSAAERHAYLAAIGEGRKATIAKKYDDAIAAFSRALTAVPGDARALGERGYARFLAHDYDKADDDLQFAIAAVDTKDNKLHAQLEFNLGLIADARNSKGVAAGHYRRSNELNPTAAAKSRMIGCPVTTGAPTTTIFPTLAAAVAKLGGTESDYTERDDAAGVRMHDQSGQAGTDVLLPIDGGRFANVQVGSIMTWNCGTLGEVAVKRTSDVWAVTFQAHHGAMTEGICTCDDAMCNGNDVNPTDPKCKCDTPFCPMICGGADELDGEHSESYVDAKTGAGLASFTVAHEYIGKVTLSADLATRTFTTSGLGCP